MSREERRGGSLLLPLLSPRDRRRFLRHLRRTDPEFYARYQEDLARPPQPRQLTPAQKARREQQMDLNEILAEAYLKLDELHVRRMDRFFDRMQHPVVPVPKKVEMVKKKVGKKDKVEKEKQIKKSEKKD